MALNPTIGFKKHVGGLGLLVRVDCNPSGNYTTDGDALSFTAAGLPGTKLPHCLGSAATVAKNDVSYVPSGARDTGKCRYNVPAGTEKTNAQAYSTDDDFSMWFVFSGGHP